ncbi:hypothetical protein E2C01_101475 [Portunus trituberculatus]|uniref:Uncharacterized protein n=1 Tax=Portunus trituberculatus TaxID=210409 RepID=A0A5B7KM25_PORTR|nr:hypothetical protein [Portunus trituberculatus]
MVSPQRVSLLKRPVFCTFLSHAHYEKAFFHSTHKHSNTSSHSPAGSIHRQQPPPHPEETTKKINEFLKEITYNLMPSLVNPNQLRGTLMAMETGGTFKSHWRFNCEKNCINPFYPLPYSAPINVTMIWVKQLLPVGE